MKYAPTRIDGIYVVETDPFEDSRGTFARLFCADEMREIMGSRRIEQINLSHSKEVGTVRGLHCQQPPNAEMKLVSCVKGRVWDVAVDLRANSKTFRMWHAEELTPSNGRALVIPEGCAHGFQVLEAETTLLYLHTGFYKASSEIGFQAADPALNIPWPLPVVELSLRDRAHPLLTPEFTGLLV